jgi:hypothetical protein
LVSVPEKKPRTLCVCRPNVAIGVFSVVPPGAFIKVMACSVLLAVSLRAGTTPGPQF